ncbi:uncharacterized protein LDX57_000971 [Aspergillus melleus]|uniref:uncharacterized protein n=1 Tax=Aspergillus melleus TaxID=138277 RepID=UPI001E8D44F9|nr:uncharacterized protein LDX57_000971 [Aspergillus melleus]KAH8423217.1 hypothetical protein LDX57_000971 [Aspergillus melleus]
MVKRTAEEAHIDEPVRQTRRAYSQSQQGGVAAAPVHELIDVDAYTRDFAHVSPEQGETASAPAYSYVDGDDNANVYSQAHVNTSPQQGEFLSAPAPDFAYDDANAYSAAFVNSSSQQEGFASASAPAPAYGNVSAQQEEFAPASGYNYTGAEANAPAYVNPNPFDNIHGRPYVSSYAHLYADPNANVNPTVNPYNPYFPQPLAEPASAQQLSPVITPEPTYDGSSAQVPVEQTALDTEAGGSSRRRGSVTARGKGKARAGASARVNRESQASKNSQQFRATHLRGATRAAAAAAAAIPATPVAPVPHTPRTPAPQFFGAEGEGGPSNWAETAGRPIGLEDYILEEDEDPFLGGTNANGSVVAGPSNWAQTAGRQIGLKDYTLDGDEVPFIEDDIVEDDNDSVGNVDENVEDNVDDNVDDNIDNHIDDDDVDPDAIILEEESEEGEDEAARKRKKKKKGKGKAKAAGKKRKTRRRKFEDEVDHSKIIRDRQQPSIDAHLAWEAKCQAYAEQGKEVPQKLAKEKPKSRTGTSCDRCVILRLSCDPDPFCCKNCQEVRGGAATCRETRKNTNITERRGEVELVTEAMLDEIHERNGIIYNLRVLRNSLLTDNGLLEVCIKRLCAQLRRAGLEPDLGNFIQAYFHNQPAPNVHGVQSMPGNEPVSDPGMAAGPMQGHYTAHNQPAVPPVPQGPPPHAQGQNGPRLMPPAEIAGPSHVNDQTMPQQMGCMRRPAANDQLTGWQGMTTGNMPFQNPYQAVPSQAQVDPRQVGSYPGMLTPHAQRAQMFMQPPTAAYQSMQTNVNQFQQGAVPQQTMPPHNSGVGLSGTVDPNWDDNAAQNPTGVTNWTGVGNQPMGPADRMGLPAMSPTVGTMPNPTPVRNEFDDLFDAERAQAQDPSPIGDADDASLHDEGQFQNDDEGYDPASTSAEYPGTGEYPEGGPADQCQVGGVNLEGLTSITGLPEQPQDPGSFDSVQTQLDEVAADIVQFPPDVASHIFSSDAMPAGPAGSLIYHEESTRDEGATPGDGSNLEELTPVPRDMWEEAEQLRDEPVEDQARFEARAAVNQPSSGTEGIILGEVEQEAFWGLPNSLDDINPSLLVANALDLTAPAHHEVYMPSFPNDASGLEGQGEEVEGRPSEAAPASGERQEEEETAQQVPNDEAPEGPYDDADDDSDSLFAGVDDNGPDELVEAGAFEGPTIAQGVAAEERVAVDSDDDTYATDDSVVSLAAGRIQRKRQRSPPGHLDNDTRDRKRQRR